MMAVTLKDIAREAEVSVYTVSCALSGRGRVASSTASRIKKIAEAMGYMPNSFGSVLGRQRHLNDKRNSLQPIAFIIFPEQDASAATDMVQRYESQLTGKAKQHGFDLQIINFFDYPSAARLSNVLWSRGVQAIILGAFMRRSTVHIDLLDGFRWERFCVLQIARAIEAVKIDTVRWSAFSQTKLCFENILKAGYRRIGFLAFGRRVLLEDDWSRMGAVYAFQENYRGQFDALKIRRFNLTEGKDDFESILSWIQHEKLDVVVSFPGALLNRLRHAGMDLPEGVDYVGLPIGEISNFDPTCIFEDFCGLAFQEALVLLSDSLVTNRRGIPAQSIDVVLPPVWKEGSTTRLKVANRR